MNHDYDILIVGSGLVGGSLALALRDAGLHVGIVDAQIDAARLSSPSGNRALALSRGTRQILQGLGMWKAIEPDAMAIRHIQVSDQGHFGKTRLHAADTGVDALGHVVVARLIEEAISHQLDNSTLTRLCPARIAGLKAGRDRVCVMLKHNEAELNVTTRLLVGADGGNSTVRTLLNIGQKVTDYGQTAIVTEIMTSKDNQHTAYERFTASGPLAVLPLARRKSSVVWTLNSPDAQNCLQLDTTEFTARLQKAFGYWLGEIELAATPVGFPLKLIRAERMTDDRVVLIGNAMHQIHPVAGQGFNLGLRDAALLAERVQTKASFGEDIGSAEFLSRFAQARDGDLNHVIRFTDSLVRMFSTDSTPVTLARNAALMALDRIPPAKRLLAKHAMGYGIRL